MPLPAASLRLRPRFVRVASGLLALAAIAPVGPAGFDGPGPGGPRFGRTAAAQSAETQVYVDDSPRARDLLLRALDQADDNTGEAARIIQTLLEEFGDRLVPDPRRAGGPLVGVRRAALEVLGDDPALLARYRTRESAEADRLLAAGDLARLVATRPLTAAGLEARLRLGQVSLEAARFDEAIDHLEAALEHPDLDDGSAAVAWSMIGTAAHFALDRPWITADAVAAYSGQRTTAAAALVELGPTARPEADALTAVTGAGAGARIDRGAGPMDRARTDDLVEAAGEVIWSVRTMDRRVVPVEEAAPITPTPPSQARRTATITEDVVHIADGRTVIAVDRFTARPIWPTGAYVEGGSAESYVDDAIGLRPVAVHGDAVVTITGKASSESATTKNSAYVVRLDARTGLVDWRTRIGRLAGREEYAGLFPHGKPWIADDRVLVLARRVTNERILSCYVIALDLETGDPVWVRHVASVGTRIPVDKPVTSLLYDRGLIYVASPVGATACLDAATGHIRWLVRSAVPSLLLGPAARAFEVGGPILVDGRLVAIRPDHRAVEIRNPDDGRLVDEIPLDIDQPWGEPDYLLTDGTHIFAIGDDVRCFRLDLTVRPQWTLPPRTGDFAASPVEAHPGDEPAPAGEFSPLPANPLASPSEPFTITGRVLVATETVLVPTSRGLLLADRETGEELESLAFGAAGEAAIGAVAAIDRQIVLASPDVVSSFMSIELAERMLRDRIARLPAAASPRLALVRLAIRVRRLPLVLEAAGVTLEAIDALEGTPDAAAARRSLFETLITADPGDLLDSAEDGAAFFALVGQVARTAEDEVSRLLAQGDWLAGRDPAAAVAAWHAILEDPARASIRRRDDDRMRRAADWATERIETVLAAGDPAVSAEIFAAADAALVAAGADPLALQTVARRWPFAPAAATAARRAAATLAAAGDATAAAALLLDTYRAAPTEARAADRLGAALDHLVAGGRTVDAAGLARVIDGRHPGLRLRRADPVSPPRPALAWADGDAPETPAVPPAGRVRLLGGTPSIVPGILLAPSRRTGSEPWTEAGFPAAPLLVRIGSEVRRLDPVTLEPQWATDVDAAEIQLADAGDAEILLWTGDVSGPGGMRERAAVVSLDAATGAIRWTSPPIDQLLPPTLGGDRLRSRMPDGLPFLADEVLVRVRGERVVLARRTGGIVCLDRAFGDVVLWTLTDTLEELHEIELDDLSVVATGRRRRGGQPEAAVVVLDAATGDVRALLDPIGRDGIKWIAMDGVGGAVLASTIGLEGIDLFGGRPSWAHLGYAVRDAEGGWRRGRTLVVRDVTDGLNSLDTDRVALGPPWPRVIGGEVFDLTVLEVVPWDRDVLARTGGRVVRFAPDGTILGADAIEDERAYLAHVTTDDGMIFVLSGVDVRIGRGTREPVYRLYTFDPTGRVADDVVETDRLSRPIIRMAWSPGWILLSTSREVIAIPLVTASIG